MKRMALYFVSALAVAGCLSAFTKIDIPGSVLSTLYAVAGVIFSVGMSMAIAPKTDSVTRKKARNEIRADYRRVRDSFMWLFGMGTILFIATAWPIRALPSFTNNAATVFLLLAIIHFIVNFLQLQRLGDQIDDQILKEQQE